MQTARYVALFVAIQLVSLVLSALGLLVVGFLAIGQSWERESAAAPWHWILAAAWPWDNQVDGICAPGTTPTTWTAFYWSGLRNPCNNLRFVPGVSKVGRPLWRKTWGAKPGGWYAQAGWNGSGYPVLSGGRNVNPY